MRRLADGRGAWSAAPGVFDRYQSGSRLIAP
jgi:hypothetical protein